MASATPNQPPALGSVAPEFTLQGTSGAQKVGGIMPCLTVLFFFPRANTATCRTEAQDFSALLPGFTAAGAQVLGLSDDPLSALETFRAKAALDMPLLSDPGAIACSAYGVWAEKSMYGKTFMGILRTTFLIDRQGRIADMWRVARVAGHAQGVLDRAKGLGA